MSFVFISNFKIKYRKLMCILYKKLVLVPINNDIITLITEIGYYSFSFFFLQTKKMMNSAFKNFM